MGGFAVHGRSFIAMFLHRIVPEWLRRPIGSSPSKLLRAGTPASIYGHLGLLFVFAAVFLQEPLQAVPDSRGSLKFPFCRSLFDRAAPTASGGMLTAG